MKNHNKRILKNERNVFKITPTLVSVSRNIQCHLLGNHRYVAGIGDEPVISYDY